MSASSDRGRFKFIGHALDGSGPFRPSVTYDAYNKPSNVSYSYLIRYPRESDEKYARRCELAFFASPLARVTTQFVSHIAAKHTSRETSNALLQTMMNNVDGKDNSVSVFMQQFMVQAKARGSALMLVDMPSAMPSNLRDQIANRIMPYWNYISPESVNDFQIGDDGKFDFVSFNGEFIKENGEKVQCVWRFDRESWIARDDQDSILSSGEHPLGECPVIIFAESGNYPCFGQFAPIADLSKRLFNLDSELDEILRAQTFSLLTLAVPENSSDKEKLQAAKTAGETIGTNNLLIHTGQAPGFIAPPDGPASIYLERIQDIRNQISEIGLDVTQINQQESGIAMQMRFHTINSELAKFSQLMEDFERRAWDLTAKWLKLNDAPIIEWPRDFNIADTQGELEILRSMQETAMPNPVLVEQKKRIVETQFGNLDIDQQQELISVLDQELSATDG